LICWRVSWWLQGSPRDTPAPSLRTDRRPISATHSHTLCQMRWDFNETRSSVVEP
jgi:hypothetical protein